MTLFLVPVILSSMHAALKINELHKSFEGKEVVKGVSFAIEPGEIFGLLGPNGAGKSTTINMAAGVCHIGSGSIEIFGRDVVKNYRDARRMTGVMHQEIIVDTFFPIGQALDITEGYYGCPSDKKWKDLLLDKLDLRPHINKKTIQLSGGMKRRFMVAKALVHKPKLLILDEPTAGVDVDLRKSLWSFVREVNQQGTTVLLTTHYLNEAEEMCERIGIMNHGKIVALEKKDKLLAGMQEKKLIFHLKEKLLKLPSALTNLKTEQPSDHRLIVRVGSAVSTVEILQQVIAAGVQISEFETETASLEDVFLKLTKGKSSDDL